MINIVDLFCGAGGSAIGVERIENTIQPNAMYQMVANAIPPILMEEIFKTNLNIINNLQKEDEC